MKVTPSGIDGVDICGPGSPDFEAGLAQIAQTKIDQNRVLDLLRPALPFSVIVWNKSDRAIALVGVRFDIVGPRARKFSVVHYADTLRNPEKADFKPGTPRFVCAEPAYTSLAMTGEPTSAARAAMNLDNLRRMLHIRASLDCVAFDDGRFAGPDTQEAFARFARERLQEESLIQTALKPGNTDEIEVALKAAAENQAERSLRPLGKQLLEALESGGIEEMRMRATSHRLRAGLWR